MSSFSEFSKEASKPHATAKNREKPGNERSDRESSNPRTKSTSDRSQKNRDNAQTSRL